MINSHCVHTKVSIPFDYRVVVHAFPAQAKPKLLSKYAMAVETPDSLLVISQTPSLLPAFSLECPECHNIVIAGGFGQVFFPKELPSGTRFLGTIKGVTSWYPFEVNTPEEWDIVLETGVRITRALKVSDDGVKSIPLLQVRHDGVCETIFPHPTFPPLPMSVGGDFYSGGLIKGRVEERTAGASCANIGVVLLKTEASGGGYTAIPVPQDVSDGGYTLLALEGNVQCEYRENGFVTDGERLAAVEHTKEHTIVIYKTNNPPLLLLDGKTTLEPPPENSLEAMWGEIKIS